MRSRSQLRRGTRQASEKSRAAPNANGSMAAGSPAVSAFVSSGGPEYFARSQRVDQPWQGAVERQFGGVERCESAAAAANLCQFARARDPWASYRALVVHPSITPPLRRRAIHPAQIRPRLFPRQHGRGRAGNRAEQLAASAVDANTHIVPPRGRLELRARQPLELVPLVDVRHKLIDAVERQRFSCRRRALLAHRARVGLEARAHVDIAATARAVPRARAAMPARTPPRVVEDVSRVILRQQVAPHCRTPRAECGQDG